MSTSIDKFSRSVIGCDPQEGQSIGVNGSATAVAMAALNTGVCARIKATDTRDFKAVKVNWSVAASPGTVQLRVETVDPTTGKPTGTLYDAAAVKDVTPTAGDQTVTFDTLPTTGRTIGAEYDVLLLTTVAGTTQTLRAYRVINPGRTYPTIVLTAADGTTRSNFGEVLLARPCMTFVMEDDAEELFWCTPYATFSSFAVYGTRAFGAKLTIETPIPIIGIGVPYATRSGTPSGDLRGRIFDASDVLVATCTVDKESLLNVSARGLFLPFDSGPILLAAGVYRVFFDQTDHASTSGNNFTFYTGVASGPGVTPQGWIRTETTDIDAGPIVWTDTDTQMPILDLVPSDFPAPAASGGVIGGPNKRGGKQ